VGRARMERVFGWIAIVGLFGLATGLAGASSAQTAPDPRNRASFQVVVTREVENDWATARLSAMAEGKDPAAVAAEVNGRMQKALARAKKEKGIEVESGGYVTQPVYEGERPGMSSVGDGDGKSRIVRWQAWQELRLESADVDRLSKLIGALQEEQLALSGIEFTIKRETREALEDELTVEALRKFRARADLVAKGLAGKAWSLVAVSVGQGGAQPRYQSMRADMVMKSAPAPAFEAGKSDLQVTVDGTIELD
jgi:predicted secreted protein